MFTGSQRTKGFCLISLETGEKHELNLDSQLSIGREADNSGSYFILDHKTVSRKHAKLDQDHAGVYIVDQESRNGTKVNDRLLEKGVRQYLKTGDMLSFAGSEYLFEKTEKDENQIIMEGILARIEEVSGRRKFIIDMDTSGLHDFEKNILTIGECDCTLPMHSINIDGKEQLLFDFTGYMQLNEFITSGNTSMIKMSNNDWPVQRALEILVRIIKKLKRIEDYILSVDRLPLTDETIFINLQNGDITFAYLPSISDSLSLQQRIIKLMDRQSHLYKDNDIATCFDRLKDMILNKNLGLDGMLHAIGLMQRELNYSLSSNGALRRSNSDLPNITLNDNSGYTITDDSKELKEDKKINGNRSIPQINRNNFKFVTGKSRLILIQTIIVLSLIAIYFSKILESSDFVGFGILVAGVDLWLIKSMKNV